MARLTLFSLTERNQILRAGIELTIETSGDTHAIHEVIDNLIDLAFSQSANGKPYFIFTL